MTLLICQNASTDRCPQPSTWYHSSRDGRVVISAGSWTGTTAGLST